MIPILLNQLATVTHGVMHQINAERAANLWLHMITTNSYQRPMHDLFVALKGKRFDGHHFAKDAISAHAIALLVDRPLNIFCPQIIVKDTRLAIGKLAAWVRSKSKAKVIGLTGSSGKTSVKEMVAAILSNCGTTLFTDGNLNNNIGVILTLLRCTAVHQYAVIEIGANHIGEIKYAANIVKPNSVLVNNLCAAHLEGFGSLSGVAKGKGEIFQGLTKNGTAVINLDSHDWKTWRFYFNKEQTIWRFSVKQQNADFYTKNISTNSKGTKFDMYTPTGVISISLPRPGKHNIANALAATALAMSVGATLEQVKLGLTQIQPVSGRLYPINLSPKKLILDDTYNANTDSMIAAADVLSAMPGYRILVVGDMNELGNHTNKCHQVVGNAARKINLNKVFSIGKSSAIISKQSGCGEHFSSKKALIAKIITLIQAHKTISVLVKGSRSAMMEEVVHGLQEHFLC